MVVRGYTRAQIRLHWAVVALLIPQYLLHDGVAGAFERGLAAGRMTLTLPAAAHMGLGLLILFLALWRLALRHEHGAPPPPAGEPFWAVPLAKGVHGAFYAVLIALPVTGALAWALASAGLARAHEALRAVLLALVAVHVGAVLMHQLVWKTGLMARMRRGAG